MEEICEGRWVDGTSCGVEHGMQAMRAQARGCWQAGRPAVACHGMQGARPQHGCAQLPHAVGPRPVYTNRHSHSASGLTSWQSCSAS